MPVHSKLKEMKRPGGAPGGINLLARLQEGEKPIICIVGFFGMSVPITIKERCAAWGWNLPICWMLIRLFK